MRVSRSRDTKMRIVAAARRLFSQKGFSGTSLADIAREVGIQKPSLYYFFRSKEEIYFTVINTVVEEVAEMFSVVPARDARDVFKEVVGRSLRRGIDDGAGMVSQEQVSVDGCPELLARVEANLRKMRTNIESFLSACCVENFSFAGQVLIDCNQMYLIRVARGEEVYDVDEYVEHLADMLLPRKIPNGKKFK